MELDFFKAEHAVLLDLRQRLLDGMDDGRSDLARLRARLSGLLLKHLAKEDRHLYPSLKRLDESVAALLAAKYEREMGDLAARWCAALSDWPEDRIARDRNGFCDRMRPLLDALASRIHREEHDLYPAYAAALADAAAATH
ncbi:hemerythrin domain-containing protein [Sphingobium lignivorans]|uniref:Hemerythrin-like domain-containing protein n=1 Tax=Sphingobium lignivorans TaxID=2735886 RepID=A0ABR6NIJ8_9SPHN|nr:hemerythrin domain-containing protein [Sphingobium lignivorans]MBB5986452.1 hypothetical protein [Sphingobium lignivorans]